MKRKILAFGASSSRQSINKRFATYASSNLSNVEVTILDLNDFEMPIYSIDKENESGIPALAKAFKNYIKAADGLIISFAEHNGAYTAAFKNVMDWVSRMEGSIWEDKPMLLLATSPGGRGGRTVLEIAFNSFSRRNKNIVLSFSLPSFNQNFTEEGGILDDELSVEFHSQLKLFGEAVVNDKDS